MHMSPRVRTVLHLLLAIALAVPGIAAPMQAVREALAAMPVAMPMEGMEMARAMPGDDMAGMPCDRMGISDTSSAMPTPRHGDGACCNPHTCDLSACLGTGCLPELPRIAAFVPASTPPVPWRQPAQPARLIETPLRPPIA